MEKYVTNNQANTSGETIVIPDECGDTLWDSVLQQEAIAGVKPDNNSRPNSTTAVQVSDTTHVER